MIKAMRKRKGRWQKHFCAVLLSLFCSVFPVVSHAETGLTMLPPQLSSPAGDVYMWGDRLIISFRLTGDPSAYSVGVMFGTDGSGNMLNPASDQNLVTFELQLDGIEAYALLSQFTQGKQYVYGRAQIILEGETLIEKPFWVLHPARRWPDALTLSAPMSEQKAGEVQVDVVLPETRFNENYFLELVRLPMLLPGGTETIPYAVGDRVVVSESQQTYTLEIEDGEGVYEVRINGAGGFTRDVVRFQYPQPMPEVSFQDTGIHIEENDNPLFEFVNYSGLIEMSNLPKGWDKNLLIRSVDDAQVAGNFREIYPTEVSAGLWQADVLFTKAGEFELTTSDLEDEIVLGYFSVGLGEPPLEFAESSPNRPSRVLLPGESFSFEVSEYSFYDGNAVWIILRENISGRRPAGAPASQSDRVISRQKVLPDQRILVLSAPQSGDFRVDLEMPIPEQGGPSGIVIDSHAFSVHTGEGIEKIEMETPEVIMGSSAIFTVELAERCYAAPVTLEAVRMRGISSAGTIFASRTPPEVFSNVHQRLLWDYETSNSNFASPAHSVGWSTWLWVPGRYEARAILGSDAQDDARIIARSAFEVVAPETPGAILAVADDPESKYRLAVDLQLPGWASRSEVGDFSSMYGFHIAIVRPAARTFGNALRFDEILETLKVDELWADWDGYIQVYPDRPYAVDAEFEAWLLLEIPCFAKTCPKAIIDRMTFSLAQEPDAIVLEPEHILEHFIFPEDDSLQRQGRRFPDLIPDEGVD